MHAEKKEFLDLALCRECGGRCCQASPGIWVDPERFFSTFFAGQRLTVEQLRDQLPALGLVFWERTGVPMPAPRSLASGCIFLGPDGCRFSVAERPCQCLALTPDRKTLEQPQGCHCQSPEEFSRDQARQRWQKYWQRV